MPEDGAAVTVSGLNSLRREALEELLQLRGKRGPFLLKPGFLKFSAHVREQENICRYVFLFPERIRSLMRLRAVRPFSCL